VNGELDEKQFSLFMLFVQIVAEKDNIFHMLFAALHVAAMLYNIELNKKQMRKRQIFYPYCNH
jgi:hypothetical protein